MGKYVIKIVEKFKKAQFNVYDAIAAISVQLVEITCEQHLWQLFLRNKIR